METTIIHVCPNGCNGTWETTAYVQEVWETDAVGDFIELIETTSVLHRPSNDNIWTCKKCGADGITLECWKLETVLNRHCTEIFIPKEKGRKKVYWRELGEQILSSSNIQKDKSGEFAMIGSKRLTLPEPKGGTC